MNEDHDRIQELLAGYVLLSLSGEDAVEADRLLSEHVPSCPLCRDQVAGFQAVAGDLATAVSPVQPPDLLLPRIRRGVDETPIRGRHRASLVAVAAGVAAIVGLAGLSVQLGGRVSRIPGTFELEFGDDRDEETEPTVSEGERSQPRPRPRLPGYPLVRGARRSMGSHSRSSGSSGEGMDHWR